MSSRVGRERGPSVAVFPVAPSIGGFHAALLGLQPTQTSEAGRGYALFVAVAVVLYPCGVEETRRAGVSAKEKRRAGCSLCASRGRGTGKRCTTTQ
jgi:hypothetical protein